MKKKALSCILVIIMLFSCIPLVVFASGESIDADDIIIAEEETSPESEAIDGIPEIIIEIPESVEELPEITEEIEEIYVPEIVVDEGRFDEIIAGKMDEGVSLVTEDAIKTKVASIVDSLKDDIEGDVIENYSVSYNSVYSADMAVSVECPDYNRKSERIIESARKKMDSGEIFPMNPGEVSPLGLELVYSGGRAYLYDEVTEECIELFSDGDGTADNPFIIRGAQDLFQLEEMVNDRGYSMVGMYFYQEADIDLGTTASNPWKPIGCIYNGNIESIFAGNYLGNGHTVSGIYIKGNSSECNGLFGVTLNAFLSEIRIDDCNIANGDYCGSLVGLAFDTDIVGCSATQDVSVTSSKEDANIGGIVGQFYCDEDDCLLSYCSSGAKVTAKNDSSVAGGIGGVVYGYSNNYRTSMVGCEFTGKVKGGIAGGIVGVSQYVDIIASYSKGSNSSLLISGGICANTWDTDVAYCYNVGSISSEGYACGIAGALRNGTIAYSYNAGLLDGDYCQDDIICIWDDYTYARGNYGTNDSSPGATYITKSQLKKASNLPSFNFESIWTYKSGQNSGYPVLQIFYPELYGVFDDFDGNNPDYVGVVFISKLSPLLSISSIPSGYWYSESEDGVTYLVISDTYFKCYTPTGKYTYDAHFGAGRDVQFTVIVKNNCLHEFGRVESKNSTCIEDGYRRIYCTSCGMLLNEEIKEKSGHNYQRVAAKEPTCSEIGWNAHTACKNCGDSSDRIEYDAIAHSLVYHEGKEMTWDSPGWKPYETCRNCSYTTYEAINPVHPERVTVSGKTTVSIGEQTRYTASVSPYDTTHKAVIWSSSNENVVSISSDGTAIAISAGTAYITATTEDGGIEGTLKVTVPRSIQIIELSGTTTVASGKSTTITANTYCYENGKKVAVKGTLAWRSSNTSVATVSGGKVTGKSAGIAVITAYVPGTDVEASIEINIVAPITALKISTTKLTTYVGSIFELADKLTITPLNHTDEIVWTSSNENVCTVDENGVVTALSKGSAKITATAVGGNKKVTCTVTVDRRPEGIAIEGNGAVALGKSVTLKAYAYYMEDGKVVKTKDAISWESYDESIATVSKGKVTGKGAGETAIRAYIEGTDIEEYIYINVAVPVKSLKLSSTKVTAYEGTTLNLGSGLTVEPFDNTDEILWTSSDEDVCTVDENGVVTIISKGSAKITATAVAGNKKATCTVTVARRPEGIIVEGSGTVAVGKSITLKAYAYYMENGKVVKTKDVISWYSYDEDIATVSKGKVAGKSSGNTAIVAYIEGTELAEIIDCSVVVPAKSVKLSLKKYQMAVWDEIDLSEYLTVSPDDHTDTISWKSSKESVAIVDSNGVVTAVGTGSAKITVTAEGGKKTATITITVK